MDGLRTCSGGYSFRARTLRTIERDCLRTVPFYFLDSLYSYAEALLKHTAASRTVPTIQPPLLPNPLLDWHL